jgi:hypothetical protein
MIEFSVVHASMSAVSHGLSTASKFTLRSTDAFLTTLLVFGAAVRSRPLFNTAMVSAPRCPRLVQMSGLILRTRTIVLLGGPSAKS